jgi:hypothetical protein
MWHMRSDSALGSVNCLWLSAAIYFCMMIVAARIMRPPPTRLQAGRLDAAIQRNTSRCRFRS